MNIVTGILIYRRFLPPTFLCKSRLPFPAFGFLAVLLLFFNAPFLFLLPLVADCFILQHT